MSDHRVTACPSITARQTASAVTATLCTAAVLLVVVGKISPLPNVPKWDEFIYLYDAQRVLTGHVPYRDFFQFTPPGDIFVLAGWFRVFTGRATVTWGRYLSALVAILSWLWIGRTLRRSGWSRGLTFALASLYPICLYTFWPIPSHHWMANLVFIGAFEAYDFERARVRGAPGWFYLGMAGGFAFLFLQTAAADMAAFWGVLWLLGIAGRKKIGSALWATAGVFAVVAPVFGWFFANGALGDLLRDVFLWTAGHYRVVGGVNAVPLLQDLPGRIAAAWSPPAGTNPLIWGPLAVAGSLVFLSVLSAATVILVATAWRFGGAIKRGLLPDSLPSAVLCLSVVEFSLFLMGKPDWLHLVYALGRIGPAWLFLGPPKALARKRIHSLAAVGVGLIVLGGTAFGAGWMCFQPVSSWEFMDADRPVREAPVNRYLRSRPWLGPDDTIAAFPEGGEVYLYVRPAAVGYTLLYPPDEPYYGKRDYLAVAKQILKNRPRCIVMTVDTAPSFLAPACPLSGPIRRNYTELRRIGDALIFKLKQEPSSDGDGGAPVKRLALPKRLLRSGRPSV